MTPYFRRFTLLLVAMCLVATWSVGGTAQNAEEVRKRARARAEAGDADAQIFLGFWYANVSQDYTEAARWYRLAADQGHAAAQNRLGRMYTNGEGVPENDTEAVRWFRLAADQGVAAAQFNLGLMYGRGEGVPQDDVQAYVWFSLAAAQGNSNAQHNRDIIAERLTPGQRAEAQRLARDWRPRNTPSPGGSVPRIEDADPDGRYGGTGTAFIVDPSGVLLTAQHVIDRATSITVACNGGPTPSP